MATPPYTVSHTATNIDDLEYDNRNYEIPRI